MDFLRVSLVGFVLALIGFVVVAVVDAMLSEPYPYATAQAPQALPYAVLISTNLVRQNCSCGVCDHNTGIVVPEHINQLGYDLRLEVSTNYLPIISK